MPDFKNLCSTADVAPGTGKCIEVDGTPVAVFNVDGQFHAISHICAHQGGPLGEGLLEGTVVTCPWHGWQFDVTTGVSPLIPTAMVERYECRVEGDQVQVAL